MCKSLQQQGQPEGRGSRLGGRQRREGGLCSWQWAAVAGNTYQQAHFHQAANTCVARAFPRSLLWGNSWNGQQAKVRSFPQTCSCCKWWQWVSALGVMEPKLIAPWLRVCQAGVEPTADCMCALARLVLVALRSALTPTVQYTADYQASRPIAGRAAPHNTLTHSAIRLSLRLLLLLDPALIALPASGCRKTGACSC